MPFTLFCPCRHHRRPRRSFATRTACPPPPSLLLRRSVAPSTLTLTSAPTLWASLSNFHCFPPSSSQLRPLAARHSPPPPPCPLFSCIVHPLPYLRSPDARRKFPFPPRGHLKVADTQLGIPHEAEACTVSWLEKPTCLECLGPTVPPPLS